MNADFLCCEWNQPHSTTKKKNRKFSVSVLATPDEKAKRIIFFLLRIEQREHTYATLCIVDTLQFNAWLLYDVHTRNLYKETKHISSTGGVVAIDRREYETDLEIHETTKCVLCTCAPIIDATANREMKIDCLPRRIRLGATK